MVDLGDGPARIGCESCGERYGCVCDQLRECAVCGAEFLPGDDDGPEYENVCEGCRLDEDEDEVYCKEGEDDAGRSV